MPVHYVTQKEQSEYFKISATNVLLGSFIVEESRAGPSNT